jgi:hypothetical protein
MGRSRGYSFEQARGTLKRTVGVRQRRLPKASLKMPSPDLKLKLFEAVATRETRNSEDYRDNCRNRLKRVPFLECDDRGGGDDSIKLVYCPTGLFIGISLLIPHAFLTVCPLLL